MSSEGSEGSSKSDGAPGWGLPSPEPGSNTSASTTEARSTGQQDAPLTPLQQAVVEEVAEGQRALGREMRWSRASRWQPFSPGGVIGSSIDSALASRAARDVGESERRAEFLAGPPVPGSDEVLHVPAGGPPTPDEVHEAEMHPWPHHGMADTIERNRQLRGNPAGVADGDPPPEPPSS
jgi:hypothetical protein